MNPSPVLGALALVSLAGCLSPVADTPAAEARPQRQLIPQADYAARDARIESLRSRLLASNPQLLEPLVHQNASGQEMPYRLFKPALPPAAKAPLVLFLHGSSARGTDNLGPITGNNSRIGAGIWTLPENQAAHPCFVLVPQCPPPPADWAQTGGWTGTARPHHAQSAPALAMVLEILDEVVKKHPVDASRVYVVGASMGGFGTWDLIARQPGRFAAAVPVCGGLADGQARHFAHLPVWIFHGESDDLVPVRFSREAFEQLVAHGGHPRFTEYEKAAHHISIYAWTEPGLMDWLFSQRK